MQTTTIQLTDQQIEAVPGPGRVPVQVLNPRTNETFVLLPLNEYERLVASDYDDSPLTKEELSAVAWETGRRGGWDDMDEYDDFPDKP